MLQVGPETRVRRSEGNPRIRWFPERTTTKLNERQTQRFL